MATVILSARRFVLSTTIIVAYRRWRWSMMRSRVRMFCHKCAACGCAPEADARQLLRKGHYRASMLMSRIQLETALLDLCREVERVTGDKIKSRAGRAFVPYLLSHERITKRQARCASRVYARASRAVHGAEVGYKSARTVLADTGAVINFLSN